MSETLPRVAVLTLVSGESQLPHCRESVARQRDVDVEHVEFTGYGNREGHAALHRYVEARADEFDAFLKLDADMVLRGDRAIAVMLEYWRSRGGGALQAEFPVHDALADIPIMGVHLYAPGARWSRGAEALFVDPKPDNVHRRDRFAAFAPVVEHMPDASPQQAFTYGFHRAIKAFQFGRAVVNPWQLRAQWGLLVAVNRAYRAAPTPARRAMLLGAQAACGQRIDGREGDYRARAEEAFAAAESDGEAVCAEGAWRRLRRRRWLRLPLDLSRSVLAVGLKLARGWRR